MDQYDLPTDDEVIDLIRSVPCHFVDLTITPANVVPQAGSKKRRGTAGETVTAGQLLFRDTSDGLLYKADANAADPLNARVFGLAVNGASAGQTVECVYYGKVALGTGTNGVVYVLSNTAGGIAPVADLTTTWYATTVGVCIGSNILDVRIHASGALL